MYFSIAVDVSILIPFLYSFATCFLLSKFVHFIVLVVFYQIALSALSIWLTKRPSIQLQRLTYQKVTCSNEILDDWEKEDS